MRLYWYFFTHHMIFIFNVYGQLHHFFTASTVVVFGLHIMIIMAANNNNPPSQPKSNKMCEKRQNKWTFSAIYVDLSFYSFNHFCEAQAGKPTHPIWEHTKENQVKLSDDEKTEIITINSDKLKCRHALKLPHRKRCWITQWHGRHTHRVKDVDDIFIASAEAAEAAAAFVVVVVISIIE